MPHLGVEPGLLFLTEGGFIVLSAVLPDTLVSRLEEEEEERIEPSLNKKRNYKRNQERTFKWAVDSLSSVVLPVLGRVLW